MSVTLKPPLPANFKQVRTGTVSYVGRAIHVPKGTMKYLMGMAMHEAWKIIVQRDKVPNCKGKRDELQGMAGSIARDWCLEIILAQIKK